MMQTYELYLDAGEPKPRFRALTCEAAELQAQVQIVIAEEGARSAEIQQFGSPLFTLSAAGFR